jgi:hypothetical protein
MTVVVVPAARPMSKTRMGERTKRPMAMPIDAASLCEEGRRSKRNANILIQ